MFGPFLMGDATYEFPKAKKHFLVFGCSYFVFFAYSTEIIGTRLRIRVYFEFSTKYHRKCKHRWSKFYPLLHTDGTYNSSHRCQPWIVYQNGNSHCFYEIGHHAWYWEIKEAVSQFQRFSKHLRKRPPRFKVFQQRMWIHIHSRWLWSR